MNRSQLGAALRALRDTSGKEAKAVARSAVMSPSKLSKIETGKLAPNADDVHRILTAIGVSEKVAAEYMAVARAVATEATAWRLVQRAGLDKAQARLRELEARTQKLRVFQPSLIPGLLQTHQYARAVLSRHKDLSDETVRRTVSARLERQEALYDPSRSFGFVITEKVLTWEIVPPLVLAGQIDQLVSMARLPNVEIRVVPQAGPKHDIPNHPFVVHDHTAARVETTHAEIVVTDPRDVTLYVEKYDGFAQHSVSGDELTPFLVGIRNQLLRQQETG
ncbi:helix-turn-helix domain-containing protein [Streptomyces sp. Da 82-17]|uniref:helix-turn-helix domain-containing protein n=1 Tax=Streptomyces sp. Da 82-17 TaxID=3377116 RepID=UPI0038D42FEA